MSDRLGPDDPGSFIPVEGCVCDWEEQEQVNPETGERFGMNGKKIFEDEKGK